MHLAAAVDSRDPQDVLDRGFAVIRDDAGKLVSAADAQAGAAWSIEFKDGTTDVVVGANAPPAPPRPKKGKDDVRQGSLL
uniref:Uncharacterized protein n=1 Tax=Magnetospirillum gryphiswaldense TaxID=55518 RepID=A4TUV9_9PROT|nr:hypothetical protein MGR_0986 [Magnetospirillum gryphiswaldense MSR-1]